MGNEAACPHRSQHFPPPPLKYVIGIQGDYGTFNAEQSCPEFFAFLEWAKVPTIKEAISWARCLKLPSLHQPKITGLGVERTRYWLKKPATHCQPLLFAFLYMIHRLVVHLGKLMLFLSTTDLIYISLSQCFYRCPGTSQGWHKRRRVNSEMLHGPTGRSVLSHNAADLAAATCPLDRYVLVELTLQILKKWSKVMAKVTQSFTHQIFVSLFLIAHHPSNANDPRSHDECMRSQERSRATPLQLALVWGPCESEGTWSSSKISFWRLWQGRSLQGSWNSDQLLLFLKKTTNWIALNIVKICSLLYKSIKAESEKNPPAMHDSLTQIQTKHSSNSRLNATGIKTCHGCIQEGPHWLLIQVGQKTILMELDIILKQMHEVKGTCAMYFSRIDMVNHITLLHNIPVSSSPHDPTGFKQGSLPGTK